MPEAEGMSAEVTLTVIAGPLQGRSFGFHEHDTFIFGRAPDCHGRLDARDTRASRHHFLLEVNPPRARVRDLGSLNGTYVNEVKFGARSAQETPEQAAHRTWPEVDLNHGDRIRVGETVFLIEIHDQPVETVGDSEQEVACLEEPTLDGPKAYLPGFEVLRELGRGGMGEVFLARRLSDGATVAVKSMLSQVAVTASARSKFLREIEVLAELRHRHCVELFDWGGEGSRFHFSMEYCPGGSLADLRHKHGGKVPAELAVRLLLQSLEGLACMHDLGYVHRDLKPQNILLAEPEGVAKIADFGLSKCFEEAGLSGMTVSGAFSGTPHFMAREQITNFRYVKPETDVWSMAATFYHLVSGRYPRPFSSEKDPIAVILRESPVPIRHYLPTLPEAMAAVIDRALLDAPQDRYPDARSLSRALSESLQ